VTFTSLVQTISKKKEDAVFLLSGSPDNTCKITEIQEVPSGSFFSFLFLFVIKKFFYFNFFSSSFNLDSKKFFLILFFVILFIAIFMGKILDPI